MAADAAAMTTVVCGSSSFSAAAEAGEITTVDAVVETAVDVIPADAESFKGQTFPDAGDVSLADASGSLSKSPGSGNA